MFALHVKAYGRKAYEISGQEKRKKKRGVRRRGQRGQASEFRDWSSARASGSFQPDSADRSLGKSLEHARVAIFRNLFIRLYRQSSPYFQLQNRLGVSAISSIAAAC